MFRWCRGLLDRWDETGHPRDVKLNRRKFLMRGGLVAGGIAATGSCWLGVSQHLAARWVRQVLGDTTRRVLPAPVTPTPAAWSENKVTVCWIGHATVLINFYGIIILSDPVFAGRVGVGLGFATAGPKRFIAPALRFSELPPIDLVILSHAHLDHMDLPTLRLLKEGTLAVTARKTADILEASAIRRAVELGWGERADFKTRLGQISVEAIEVNHWGVRWPSKEARGYNGYVLRREGRSLLLGGDTAWTESFRALRSGGPYDIAVMPIAAYDPWIHNHCTPEEAVTMANAAGARYILPIHHQTFKLSDEPMEEPIRRFEAALEAEPERIGLRQIGESLSIS